MFLNLKPTFVPQLVYDFHVINGSVRSTFSATAVLLVSLSQGLISNQFSLCKWAGSTQKYPVAIKSLTFSVKDAHTYCSG